MKYRKGSKIKIKYYNVSGTRGNVTVSGRPVVEGKITKIDVLDFGGGDRRSIVSVKMPDGSRMDYLRSEFEQELVEVIKY